MDALPPKKKLPFAKLALAAGLAVAVVGVLVALVGWQTALAQATLFYHTGLRLVSSAGPVVYFVCMAVLPFFGVPTSPFAVGAGPLFGHDLGLPLLILGGTVAITFNMAVAYWLARRWLQPFLSRKLECMGYALPQADAGNATDLIILLRVTPGIPLCVQNYLLGLATVPFARYMSISCAAQWLLNVAFMLFGEALSQGRGKTALSALMLLAAVAAGANLLRKRFAKPAGIAVSS